MKTRFIKRYAALFLFVGTSAALFTACSDDDSITVDERHFETLDLSNFDLANGIDNADGKVWSETYTAADLNAGIFKFNHFGTTEGYTYFSGFTVSNSSDNQNQEEVSGNWYEDHWGGSMAQGGADGKGTPFLVAYADEIPAAELAKNEAVDLNNFNSWVELNDDANRYQAVSTKIAMSPWAYYNVTEGDQFARKFEEGDYLALHIYGLDKDMKPTTSAPVTYYMVDFRNGVKPISTTWNDVNLSPLGEVKYLMFFMESTDAGEFGANTAKYFTMDKLKVRKID